MKRFLWILLGGCAVAPPLGLPDFSWAGYHAGDREPPRVAVARNVRDFGAKGDGATDDTEAIRRAVAEGGVVFFPPGKYVVTGVVEIARSGTVLRGRGATLYFPRPLAEAVGPNRGWSWSGGFLWARPREGREERLAGVAAEAKAGGRILTVDDPSRLRAGDFVRLHMTNDAGHTLLDHLYGGVVPRDRFGDEMMKDPGPRVRWPVRIELVDGRRVTLQQPLRLDVRPAWKPEIHSMPRLEEVGIEDLRLEFPPTRYPGHLAEKGYNAIALDSVVNGWVRGVEIVNADCGVLLGGCKFCTVRGVRIRADGDRSMHHGLSASGSADCLFEDWEIAQRHVHGTTISWGACGNVFSRGSGLWLAMDAHRACSYQNLHTEITVICGRTVSNPLRSGGKEGRGPHAARENVYWNVRFVLPRGEGPVTFGPYEEWPLGVFAGWHGDRPVEFKAAPGQRIFDTGRRPDPTNLHRAQMKPSRD